MNTPNMRIEWADFGQIQSRLLTAEQSQQRWYKQRHDELINQDLKDRLEYAREYDPLRRAEIQERLDKNKQQLEKLNEGMRNSSLRAGLGRSAECVIDGTPGIEQRLLVSPGAMAAPVTSTHKPGDTDAKLVGLASPYNSEADIGGYFREIVLPGAFSEVIKTCDCRCLINHSPDYLLGRTQPKMTGSLRLYDVATMGLVFHNDLPDDDPMSESLCRRIEGGDLSGCSYAFCVGRDHWVLAPRLGELDTRYIDEISELLDVSPVVYPAFKSTTVQVIRHQYQLDDEQLEDMTIAERVRGQRRFRECEEKLLEFNYARAGRIAERNRPKVQR
jgi:hypothetical protein